MSFSSLSRVIQASACTVCLFSTLEIRAQSEYGKTFSSGFVSDVDATQVGGPVRALVFSRSSLFFGEDSIRYSERNFSNMTLGTSSFTLTFVMKIQKRERVVSPHPGATSPISIVHTQMQDVLYTIHDREAAQINNLKKLCGFTDWVPGKPKSLVGTSCVSGNPSFVEEVMVYQTNKDLLFWVAAGAQEEEKRRPTESEFKIEFPTEPFPSVTAEEIQEAISNLPYAEKYLEQSSL